MLSIFSILTLALFSVLILPEPSSRPVPSPSSLPQSPLSPFPPCETAPNNPPNPPRKPATPSIPTHHPPPKQPSNPCPITNLHRLRPDQSRRVSQPSHQSAFEISDSGAQPPETLSVYNLHMSSWKDFGGNGGALWFVSPPGNLRQRKNFCPSSYASNFTLSEMICTTDTRI
ncbi:hypothetical protein K402DRAFT_396259, partial [Aulographum hederae CBS 113979]